MTYNQIIALFKAVATAHLQINSFGVGNEWDIALPETGQKEPQYPMFWVVPQDSVRDGKEVKLNFALLFMDLVHKDDANLNEVHSDCLSIGLDVLAYLENPDFADAFLIEKRSNLYPFVGKSDDESSGWRLDLTMRIPFMADRCQIPMNDQLAGIEFWILENDFQVQ